MWWWGGGGGWRVAGGGGGGRPPGLTAGDDSAVNQSISIGMPFTDMRAGTCAASAHTACASASSMMIIPFWCVCLPALSPSALTLEAHPS